MSPASEDRNRSAIVWSSPRILLYRAGRSHRWFGVQLNRYPGAVIGVAFQVAGRVVSIVWGHPTRPPPTYPPPTRPPQP